ncbi:internalin [Listeria ivanovii]|uniref:internalin N-terminal domain-containing protein n=1 Tax=Listeria ivanovii TaxID=1638 RepID=UPI0016262ECF|nr:Ig-like domain-containing protein [Listeria ivanovii]MBC2254023.1 internalin [Listeria ivanovii]
MKRNNCLKKICTVLLIIVIAILVNTNLETKAQAISIPYAMPINQIFPDYNLADVVKQHLGKQSVTDVVSQRDLDRVQNFNGNCCNITSMEGVQYFRHLKQLSMSYNQISDVSVLTPLRQLEILILEHNKLEDIDVLVNIPTLEGLYVGNNALRDLWALEAMGNLKYVDASEQKCINKPVVYQPNLVITNTIKDMIGKPIVPNFISDNGAYVNTDVTWDLPNPHSITEVSYSFEEVQHIGTEKVLFSGVVIQPIKPQTPANS